MKYTDVAALFQRLQARLVPGGANIHPPVIYCTLNISVCKKAGCETQHFLLFFFSSVMSSATSLWWREGGWGRMTRYRLSAADWTELSRRERCWNPAAYRRADRRAPLSPTPPPTPVHTAGCRGIGRGLETRLVDLLSSSNIGEEILFFFFFFKDIIPLKAEKIGFSNVSWNQTA